MTNIETTYAGLKLKNPIIVASSGLTDSAAKNQKMVGIFTLAAAISRPGTFLSQFGIITKPSNW